MANEAVPMEQRSLAREKDERMRMRTQRGFRYKYSAHALRVSLNFEYVYECDVFMDVTVVLLLSDHPMVLSIFGLSRGVVCDQGEVELVGGAKCTLYESSCSETA